ncbi:MAG TPA: hypothetical protein PLX89_05435 [Verrucomicrobiota bacterium]|nr:hypothetical protein [Verrucomicrobiales bacterium]HRI12429.1 hypothetical protein [Verrucomicrobiota bacterium]
MPFRCSIAVRFWLLILAISATGLPRADAKIQFDVFPGYDNTVRAGAWYPITIEVFNDGPSFDAVVELSAGQFGSVVTRVPVELPTNTRKRFSVPMFATSQNFLSVDGRLRDAKGKVQDERTGQRVGLVGWDVPLLGALPGSFSAQPSFPEREKTRPEWQPRVARMQAEIFPDRSIALEGLNSLYLNSARALELKEPQVAALETWVHSGGQLIIAIDQPNDVTSTPWLRRLVPAELGGMTSVRIGPALHRWLVEEPWSPQFAFRTASPENAADSGAAYANLITDLAFEVTDVPLLELRARGGQATKTADVRTWMVSAPVGRGQVVILAVNPEREPMKSWKHRPWFWAKICGVPERFLTAGDFQFRGGRGLDSVFGAMIETRQIRKLPIGALLLLLVVYLAVIGPFDQWWLKKIKRPMLTWITFPTYVALFSGLIYFIGYKLRAGQTEWNELQLVDVLPHADPTRATLRGRTFGSIYSPANETYKLVNEAPEAALRGEFKNLFGGSPDPGRLTITLAAQGWTADAFVPVWTSSLNVADWADVGDAPLVAREVRPGRFEVENRTRGPLGPVWVISGTQMSRLPELRAGATAEIELDANGAESFSETLSRWQAEFFAAIGNREQTFGSNERRYIDDWPAASVAASFPSMLNRSAGDGQGYVWPAGFDLSPDLRRGNTLVLAWMPNSGVLPPANRFPAVRSRRGALLRLDVPSAP